MPRRRRRRGEFGEPLHLEDERSVGERGGEILQAFALDRGEHGPVVCIHGVVARLNGRSDRPRSLLGEAVWVLRGVDAHSPRHLRLRTAEADERREPLGYLRVDRLLCHVAASTCMRQTDANRAPEAGSSAGCCNDAADAEGAAWSACGAGTTAAGEVGCCRHLLNPRSGSTSHPTTASDSARPHRQQRPPGTQPVSPAETDSDAEQIDPRQ